MKKPMLAAGILLALLPALAACGGKYDYTKHLSEVRSDIFRAETDSFDVTLTLSAREYPYASDGIACPMQNIAEISLVPKTGLSADYEIYVVGEREWGGEMSYRNVRGDYYYSQSVDVFPEKQVALRVEYDGKKQEIAATSVKTAETLSPEEALRYAVEAEKERVEGLMLDNVFQGEFYVRLLRRDVNYYYVGIVDKTGKTLSLLLDAETGAVLARREHG